MTDAMTGPWLIVKWVGLGVTLCYMALFVVAMWRFRGRLHRIRSTATLPIVLGNFVLLIPPWLFMKAEVTRRMFRRRPTDFHIRYGSFGEGCGKG